jgi:hypothetical protein
MVSNKVSAETNLKLTVSRAILNLWPIGQRIAKDYTIPSDSSDVQAKNRMRPVMLFGAERI